MYIIIKNLYNQDIHKHKEIDQSRKALQKIDKYNKA